MADAIWQAKWAHARFSLPLRAAAQPSARHDVGGHRHGSGGPLRVVRAWGTHTGALLHARAEHPIEPEIPAQDALGSREGGRPLPFHAARHTPMTMPGDLRLPYLHGYPPELLAQVRELIRAGRLAQLLAQRHPAAHEVRTDRALYDSVNALKSTHMRSAPPRAKVAYDPKLHIVRNALVTHSAVSRVQGSRLKATREIRVATLLKEAPAALLRMIVVHELAHLKERDHGKAFYSLCLHMEPDYHQLEFDLRLWLTAQELGATVE